MLIDLTYSPPRQHLKSQWCDRGTSETHQKAHQEHFRKENIMHEAFKRIPRATLHHFRASPKSDITTSVTSLGGPPPSTATWSHGGQRELPAEDFPISYPINAPRYFLFDTTLLSILCTPN